ncbi:MAG TPA: low molecular weight protein arginine phosphatase [Candidatus Bathyarchaeia archaeon]|nr:low molecular weight protein arginine phosphatase [Candidatus Bathyarchaeia archaeon]
MDKTKKILIVCTGNMCRSPMAEAILKEMLAERGEGGPEVTSAGTDALMGGRATGLAMETMRDEGIDITGFKSKPVDEMLIRESELVLTMTLKQKEEILSRHPNAKGKVFTLKEFAGECGELDIEDPYGPDRDRYRMCVREIKDNLRKALPRLLAH